MYSCCWSHRLKSRARLQSRHRWTKTPTQTPCRRGVSRRKRRLSCTLVVGVGGRVEGALTPPCRQRPHPQPSARHPHPQPSARHPFSTTTSHFRHPTVRHPPLITTLDISTSSRSTRRMGHRSTRRTFDNRCVLYEIKIQSDGATAARVVHLDFIHLLHY